MLFIKPGKFNDQIGQAHFARQPGFLVIIRKLDRGIRFDVFYAPGQGPFKV